MNRQEFRQLLEAQGIASGCVHFENTPYDGWYVVQNHHRWEVFWRERGKDHECMGFPSESDALNHLKRKIIPVTTEMEETVK